MFFYCRHHRRARAGWSCEPCHAKLCADCVAEKWVDNLHIDVCATCGERVAYLVEHRAETMSYQNRLRTIWRYPLCFGGIVAMGGLGVLFAIGVVGWPYLLLAEAIFWSFVFLLIQSSARGDDDIGPPDFSSLWESVGLVLFRAFVATTATWLPLFFYVWASKPALVDALVDPINWLFLVFGLVYAPMAIMGAAVRTPLIRLINPLWMVRCVALLGRDYWLAAGVLGGLTIVQCAVVWLVSFIIRIPFPLFPFVVAFALLMYVPFVMARVLGILLYVRGDQLEYGDPNDYYERVLTDRPRGVLPLPAKLAPDGDAIFSSNPAEKVPAIEVDF